MKKISFFIICLSLSACTIAVHDPEAFERKAIHIERVYNASYGDLYGCLVSRTNIPVLNYINGKEAFYSVQGYLKIVFTPITQNKTKVRASSVGSFMDAHSFVNYLDKECMPKLTKGAKMR